MISERRGSWWRPQPLGVKRAGRQGWLEGPSYGVGVRASIPFGGGNPGSGSQFLPRPLSPLPYSVQPSPKYPAPPVSPVRRCAKRSSPAQTPSPGGGAATHWGPLVSGRPRPPADSARTVLVSSAGYKDCSLSEERERQDLQPRTRAGGWDG